MEGPFKSRTRGPFDPYDQANCVNKNMGYLYIGAKEFWNKNYRNRFVTNVKVLN